MCSDESIAAIIIFCRIVEVGLYLGIALADKVVIIVYDFFTFGCLAFLSRAHKEHVCNKLSAVFLIVC